MDPTTCPNKKPQNNTTRYNAPSRTLPISFYTPTLCDTSGDTKAPFIRDTPLFPSPALERIARDPRSSTHSISHQLPYSSQKPPPSALPFHPPSLPTPYDQRLPGTVHFSPFTRQSSNVQNPSSSRKCHSIDVKKYKILCIRRREK